MSIDSDLLGLASSEVTSSNAPPVPPSSSAGQSLLDLLDATSSSLPPAPVPPVAQSSSLADLLEAMPASLAPVSQPSPASAAISEVPEKVAVQFFAVGGAQQLNDKNGKKLACKFLSSNKFAAVIGKIRQHLPGEDNLFCFISCGDAQFAPSPDALLGDLYRTAKRPAVMAVSYCNKINYG